MVAKLKPKFAAVKRVINRAKNDGLTHLFREFYGKLASGGVLLVICATVSIVLSNTAIGQSWIGFWNINIDLHLPRLHAHSLTGWVNDGLMTIFFLLVGLEIERELLVGELSKPKNALLPVLAAIGGMAFPAAIYAIINRNSPENLRGAGIPTATDIAFAIAMLNALGNRIPVAIKVFLSALAIIDDLGAILIIALFYGQGIHVLALGISLGIFLLLLLLKRTGVRTLPIYLLGGIFLWYFLMQSGIHATIAGVLLAFAIPFKEIKGQSPSALLMDKLHEPVSWFILPVFALANTAIVMESNAMDGLWQTPALGIMAGLLLGKPIGIFLASWISVKYKLASLPTNTSFKQVLGAGMLGGIGFTMAIFVANLAFTSPAQIETAKISILMASMLSAVCGFWVLSRK